MPQTMTPIGRAALKAREGEKLKAYPDSKGVWTIGVGITTIRGVPVRKGMTITLAESDALYLSELAGYEAAVRAAIKVPLADNQFDALGSICWNIGKAGFAGSTFVKRINARASAVSIDEAIMMWTKDKILISRRQAEAAQFATPYTVALPKALATDTRHVPGTISGPMIEPRKSAQPAAPSWLDRLGAWLGQVLGAPQPALSVAR